MVVKGIMYCDWCAEPIFPDELTAVHIQDKKGCSHAFQFHNTPQNPCLKAKIDALSKQFSAPNL